VQIRCQLCGKLVEHSGVVTSWPFVCPQCREGQAAGGPTRQPSGLAPTEGREGPTARRSRVSPGLARALVIVGAILGFAIIAYVWGAHSRHRVIPREHRDQDHMNMEYLCMALSQYERNHQDCLPADLAELTRSERYYLDPKFLVSSRYKVVKGSNPKSSYIYMAPAINAAPETIMVFPNGKVGRYFSEEHERVAVVLAIGKVGLLTLDEFKHRLALIGVNYEDLPEPGH
jgi:hypothetical protein